MSLLYSWITWKEKEKKMPTLAFSWQEEFQLWFEGEAESEAEGSPVKLGNVTVHYRACFQLRMFKENTEAS